MDITLIVKYKTGDDISWLFSSYIRAKKFKNIYIMSDSDYVKNMIYQTFPRQQNGNYLPNNFYTFVKDVPDNITGRVLECSSDWVKYNEFQYFLELCCDVKNDNNDHINLKIID
jgi:hypothetical protein